MIAYRCDTCGFELFHPIEDLEVGALGLYSDWRYPGRCILAFHRHVEHLEELSPEDFARLMADLQKAGTAIRALVKSPRMNYAVLGNVVPHLHVHLIPRGGPNDPVPGRPPWENPTDHEPLEDADAHRLKAGILELLR